MLFRSRSQQDSFLPHMEDGTITLVGATTENPSFELNAAVLSRAVTLTLHRLDDAALEKLLALKVTRVESLRPGLQRNVAWGNAHYACGTWAERIEARDGAGVIAVFDDGTPAMLRNGQRTYVGVWPTRDLCNDVVSTVLRDAGVNAVLLDEDVRVRTRAGITFAFNFGTESRTTPAGANAKYLLGGKVLLPRNLSAWRD